MAKREAAVIAEVAVGGFSLVAATMALDYALVSHASGHRHETWMWMLSWLLEVVLTLAIAFLGGRAVPRRTGAVVAAALAGQFLWILMSKVDVMISVPWFGLRVLAWNAVLVVVTLASARLGARSADRHRGSSDRVPSATT